MWYLHCHANEFKLMLFAEKNFDLFIILIIFNQSLAICSFTPLPLSFAFEMFVLVSSLTIIFYQSRIPCEYVCLCIFFSQFQFSTAVDFRVSHSLVFIQLFWFWVSRCRCLCFIRIRLSVDQCIAHLVHAILK